MEINNCIMNPSYQNDIYMTFVEQASRIVSDNVVAITPSKFVGRTDKRAEIFKDNIMSHIKEIVHYPDCGDIFKIGDTGGISYYLIDKDKHSEVKITNKCLTNNYINNKSNYREIGNSLNCYCDSILNKLNGLEKIKADTIDEYNYMITTPPAIGGTKGASSFIFGASGKLQVLKIGRIYNREDAIKLQSCYGLVCSGKTIIEIEYKLSYYYSKLIRFLIFAGFCTQSTLTEDTWRFVPNISDFNHIFTDTEIYEMFGINDDEIAIIDGIIKNRDTLIL